MEAFLLYSGIIAGVLEIHISRQVVGIIAVRDELTSEHSEVFSRVFNSIEVGTVSGDDADLTVIITIKLFYRYYAGCGWDTVNDRLKIHE